MSEASSFARINLEQARKLAKDLVKAHKAGDPRALDSIRWNVARYRGQSDEFIKAGKFVLADAQHVIARGHHFDSWRKMLAYIETMERADPLVLRFENAADAIVSGNIDALRAMLDERPELIRQRSTRGHHSTLLHYVSANGIEDYRQITPPNILEITHLLLDRGAEVDATSDAYGGGSTTLGLVSTSAHPRKRGVQIAMIDLLLDRGAKIDGEDDLQNLVSGALANGCPEAADALAHRGAKVNTLYAAAGVGNLDRVHALFSNATPRKRESALNVAAQTGQIEVVRFLLDHGVDVNANHGMPALHQASGSGHIEIMQLLISRGAELEMQNEYGGTTLSSTLWFAAYCTDADFRTRNLPRAVEFLIDAGARVDYYPELKDEIDAMYARAARLSAT